MQKLLRQAQGKQKVIAIVGPTASGKSALGAYLAKKLSGEIISADSRQVYRGMRIISRAEPGHMVGVIDPRRTYSAGQFAKDAGGVIRKIMIYHKIPIVVGGTGFYTEALLTTPLPQVPPNKKLRAQLAKKTQKQLLSILKKLDRKSAARVDPHNIVRVIRAIEIAKAIGKIPALTQETAYKVLWLGLLPPKNYERLLQKGVKERLTKGVAAEAKKLRAQLSNKQFLALGFEFQLLAQYIDKNLSESEFTEALVRGERQYAKRQMRWFHRNKNILWVKNKSEALRLARRFLSR
ncbi:MAG TPA: tRNA (adenosine(37)-N6)-dimethylallyltransferase MiaA [Candidatus Paceibacterota bacterium]|uniref:tRNA dimethylallyltransferase n=1 Tax=Candidatus Adlerbacteria bacterium RIFCSPLOWO2_01_FULL_51_16 TaxID=1797243 RepID=A0A1F4XGL0_9BACT|nr:MAG: tRNA (adenosine(37)-N6)-dimethylallyltransferase MiaA [Candidatus Adlerbacteria bacterium RIFCSPLOWO2_01_FULL_51_16]HXK31207.1 tRNA (adenosine(37)-N6)-dimethylallyltransferase MiaA [Candidatus Paceibacterota bacterium]